MKQSYIIFFLLLIYTFDAFAQKEASYWYFGNNAGLDFRSGVPVAITDGKLRTSEGCATIADDQGNLLFYTDGSRVWNKNHQIMPHGTNLFGHSSSTQSAIIVPKPNDENVYFIFTVDWSNGDRGLNYYTVDMSLDAGLGDVLGTDGVPTPTLLLSSPVDEKITAVKVKDEEAFWVIAKKNDRFFVYKVDASGVNVTPVSGNDGFVDPSDSRGYLKISPDGKKLVSAAMSGGTFLYDFDAQTGQVSRQRMLNLNGQKGYGVEFSPLSKKLYISTGDYTNAEETSLEVLYQFDVTGDDVTGAEINESRVELHRYQNQRAALQLGIDGKIYRAINATSFLGVISNPEVGGVGANYMHNAIRLDDKISTEGLPPFIQSFLAANVTVENNCFGQEARFSVDTNEPLRSISWDFGDGSPLDTSLNPTHRYAAPGTYTLTVTLTTKDEQKEFVQQIEILEIPEIASEVTLFQCDDDMDEQTFFNLNEAKSLIATDPNSLNFLFFESLGDAEEGDPSKAINNPTAYFQSTNSLVYARVENAAGCEQIATIYLRVTVTTLPINTRYIVHQCDDSSDGDETNGFVNFNLTTAVDEIKKMFPSGQNLHVEFYESMEDGLKEINPIDIHGYTNIVPFTQDLIVRVESLDNNACLGLGFFLRLEVDDIPAFDLDEFAYLCANTPTTPVTVQVENAQGDYTYEWTNSENEVIGTGSSQDILKPGIYAVTATNSLHCSLTKTIEVKMSDLASIESITIDDDDEINTVVINVVGPGDYQYALNEGLFQDNPFFDNVPSGIVTVKVRDKYGCGIITREIAVIGYPKFFTPNGDGYNDTWQIDGVHFQPTSLIYIYDRFGKLLVKVDPKGDGWDGRYRGKMMPDGDYWFNVKLEDGRLFKGHFSLLRK
ncbi:T9SS type B sorting domain-containing protein [Flavobacteriaceae bacterium F08102]|nr:T9SS type B sorting domain-containing protein [Flavobacteriaceae bacterium F08102]